MKTFLSICVSALLIMAVAPSAKAESVSVDVFYDNLDPYGSWLEVGDYGYVWQPRDVDPDWRPYSDGRWVYTDAGWTWNSEEPYGWAVYHYGRWANVDQVGWVWVPGTEWGPAWVSWRHSPKYVGWAPLPPEAEFREDTGFSEWVDDYYDIGPDNYRFVEVRNLGAPRLRTVFVNRTENINIIQQTTNITRITYRNNVVFNGGIGYDEVSRFSAEPIHRFKLERRERFDGDPRHLDGDRLRARVEGNSLSVIAPSFVHSSSAPKNVGRHVERVEINHGWHNAGPAAEVAAVRAKVKSEARPPANLPPRPRFERPLGREGSDNARREGDRPQGDNDRPSTARMRGDDIARRQGNMPAGENKANNNDPSTLPEGTRRGVNRTPGSPPIGSPSGDRDSRGKMGETPGVGPNDAPEDNSPRRPGGTRPGSQDPSTREKMSETSNTRAAQTIGDNRSRRPGGAPGESRDSGTEGKMNKPGTRDSNTPEGIKPQRPEGSPPEPKDSNPKGKMKETPGARPGDGPEGNGSRRPEGGLPGSREEGSQGKMKPHASGEPESNKPRRPGGAPADIPGREGRSKGNDPQHPTTPDNADGSSVRKAGTPPSGSESPARSPRKPESDAPKGRDTEEPKRSESEQPRSRPGAPSSRNSSDPSAEPSKGKSKQGEMSGRESKKDAAEHPAGHSPGAPNTNSQQERGRGNPGGKEKKKPEDNAR